MATPRLLVEIATSLGTFQADFGRASQIAEQNARRISRSVDDVQRRMVGFGRSLAAAIGIPLTAGAAFAFFDQLKDKVTEDERSINQLNAVLQATRQSAGLTLGSLEDLNRELQSLKGRSGAPAKP